MDALLPADLQRPRFRTIASKCTGFFDAADAADCVAKIKAIQTASWADDATLPRTPVTDDAARASNNDLHYVLGFFETLGLAYNCRKVDRGMIEKHISHPSVYFLADAWWYICWRRGGDILGQTSLYEEFERYVRSIRAAHPQIKQGANPKRALRLLFLPAAGSDDAAWLLAGRISTVLSERAQLEHGVPTMLVARVRTIVESIEGGRTSSAAVQAPAAIDLLVRLSHAELAAAMTTL